MAVLKVKGEVVQLLLKTREEMMRVQEKRMS